MKKTTLLYLLLGTLFLWTACSKDEKEKSRKDQLMGSWTETRTQTKVTLVNPPFPLPPIEIDTFKLVTSVKFVDATNLQFTYREDGRSKTASGTWTLTDGDQKISVSLATAIAGMKNPVFDIRELSDTQLTLYIKQRQQLVLQGANREVDAEITSYFKKQ